MVALHITDASTSWDLDRRQVAERCRACSLEPLDKPEHVESYEGELLEAESIEGMISLPFPSLLEILY